MGLRVTLEWFEKTNGFGIDEETSNIFEDTHSILSSLGLGGDHQIFDGSYDLKTQWIEIMQPHFKHLINQQNYDFQISFHHQGPWHY